MQIDAKTGHCVGHKPLPKFQHGLAHPLSSLVTDCLYSFALWRFGLILQVPFVVENGGWHGPMGCQKLTDVIVLQVVLNVEHG